MDSYEKEWKNVILNKNLKDAGYEKKSFSSMAGSQKATQGQTINRRKSSYSQEEKTK